MYQASPTEITQFGAGKSPILRVDIIADFTCPWCYIAKANLDQAIAKLHAPVEINWKPFHLFPETPGDNTKFTDFITDHISKPIPAKKVIVDMIKLGKEAKLKFNFDKINTIPNTLDAHRILAASNGSYKQHKLAEDLFQAFFEHGRDISDRGVLLDIAVTAGMPLKSAKKTLNDSKTKKITMAEIAEARSKGIDELPVIIFNYRWMVTGLQDTDTYIQAIDAALFSENLDMDETQQVIH